MKYISKSYSFLIVLAFVCLQNFAQQGFEIVIDTDTESGISGAINDGDGNVIFTGLQHFPGQPLSSIAHVIKVSPTGDTATRLFYYGEDTLCGLYKTIVTNLNNYIVFGSIDNPESNHKKLKYLWVLKLDENLNAIWDKRYKLAGDYWNPQFEVAMNDDSIIYLAGYAAIDGMTYNQHLFMMKFNQDGDTLKTSYPYFNGATKYTYGILSKPNNNGVIIWGQNFDYNITAMQALEIDSNLNYTVHSINDPLGTGMDNATAKWFSDSTYLLSCRADNDNNGTFSNNDIEIVLMTDEHQILEQHWAGRPDTSDYPAWRTSMDFVDKNNIWVSGSLQHFPSWPVNTKILVYLLDSTLNIKGMKYYGGDMNYSACTTTATSDGGCVLGGMVYDWQNSFADDQDLWIKKIYPSDILTHAEDTPDPLDSDVLVCPTLFSGELYVKTIRHGLSITLYSVNGIKVQTNEIIEGPEFILNTLSLKKGFYIYKITYKNSLIQTGKLFKQ